MFTLDTVVPWGRSFDEYRRMFALSDDDLKGRILGCADGPASFEIVEQTQRNRDEFVWDGITSVDHLYRVRTAAMDDFLADYDNGPNGGRYVAAVAPFLPFAAASFDLALCSHFLFLYSEQLGQQFHEEAIVELCRVADEVRICPILALGGSPSTHVVATTDRLQALDCSVTIERVRTNFSAAEMR